MRSLMVVALAAGLVTGPAPAAADEPAVRLEIPHHKYQLANGLEVILHEDHRLPLIAVNVWYHVGAFHEVAKRSGFAHLFEHMLFQGSAHVGDDRHFKILEQIGATGVNGTTNFDRTNYFETVPSNHLETALWLESDRMGFLLPSLTIEKLDNQREVVKNERRQSYETRPYGLAEEQLWQALFPQPHPYHGQVIGSMDDLNAATLDDVRGFFRDRYAPTNATLTIAGDFDPEKAMKLVEKYFGSLPRGEKPADPVVAEVKLQGEKVIRYPEEIASLAKVEAAWHTPKLFAPGDAEADILSAILTTGKASRLRKRLEHELQIAQSVSTGQASMGAQSLFFMEAVARPGVDTQRLLDEMDAALQDIRDNGVTDVEVRRALNRYETSFVAKLQKLGGFGGKADQLQTYNHFVGDPDYLHKDLARYRGVTAQGVQDFVKTHLAPDARVVLFATPKPKSEKPADAGPDGEPAATEAGATEGKP